MAHSDFPCADCVRYLRERGEKIVAERAGLMVEHVFPDSETHSRTYFVVVHDSKSAVKELRVAHTLIERCRHDKDDAELYQRLRSELEDQFPAG